ncbi:MAG: hypothetical protein KKI06_03385 [Euryarchaeota archaeon]|nr:hypothetical protein [Euryarchaeota archaeon]
MGIETYIEGIDFASPNNLLIIANVILIIIAFFLLIRLRISKKKREAKAEPEIQPKKETKGELAGIAEIKPEDFRPERFDIKSDFFAPAKPSIEVPITATETVGATSEAQEKPWMRPEEEQVPEPTEETREVPEAEAPESDELEDELPEEFVVPRIRKLNIPTLVAEKEKLEEKPAVSPEPELAPTEIEEKALEEVTLPLELGMTTSDKEEEKPEEEVTLPLKLDITMLETEEKKEELKEEAVTIPQEPEITAPPELNLFTLEMDEKKPEDKVEVPVPEFKEPEKKEEIKEEAVTVPHEPEITAPHDVKLFNFGMEEKKPEEKAEVPAPEVKEPEKKEEVKEKKSKRKSLF